MGPAPDTDTQYWIYRKGGANPGNLRLRAKDTRRPSCWDSLERVTEEGEPAFLPGDEWCAIDVRRLPASAVEYDNSPPRHVSILDLPPDDVKDAIVRGGGFLNDRSTCRRPIGRRLRWRSARSPSIDPRTAD